MVQGGGPRTESGFPVMPDLHTNSGWKPPDTNLSARGLSAWRIRQGSERHNPTAPKPGAARADGLVEALRDDAGLHVPGLQLQVLQRHGHRQELAQRVPA